MVKTSTTSKTRRRTTLSDVLRLDVSLWPPSLPFTALRRHGNRRRSGKINADDKADDWLTCCL